MILDLNKILARACRIRQDSKRVSTATTRSHRLAALPQLN